MKKSPAFSLIELLVVVTIIGTVLFVLYLSYTRSQANQGLRSSAEQLVDTLRRAHVFAREARTEKSWGVVWDSKNSYSLVAGTPDKIDSREGPKQLEAFVEFPQEFNIWFDIGTGETNEAKVIVLENEYKKQMRIRIYKSGLIEIVEQTE